MGFELIPSELPLGQEATSEVSDLPWIHGPVFGFFRHAHTNARNPVPHIAGIGFGNGAKLRAHAFLADLHRMRVWVVLAFLGPWITASGQHDPPDTVAIALRNLGADTREQYVERAIDLATAYRSAGMLDSALAVAWRALDHATDDRDRSRAHFTIARVLTKLQDNTGAQEHARESIVRARAAKDTASWLRGEAILAEVDMDQNRYDAAKEHIALVHALATTLSDTGALATVHTYMGNILSYEGKLDSARWHYERSLAYIPLAGSKRRLTVRMNQVNLFIDEERYDSAMARSDAMREEVLAADPYMRSMYHNQRGYALFSAGRFREAIPEFVRSDSINNADVNELSLRIENTGFLAESYAAIGDSARGYLLLLDLEVLKDSFAAAASDERMLTLEKQFETRLNKEEIARLDNENRQKADHLRVRNLQLYGSLALAVLASGAVVLVVRDLRRKRTHAAQLEGLNAGLHEKQARIEEVNGLLRMKLLRTQMDPHFIHNCLNAIRALSLKGEHDRADDYLDGFARLLRNVLEHSVRDRIALEEEIDFLNDYVRLEHLRLGADFSWSITADEALLQEGPLVPSLLVQPFVENAIWHGLAPKQGAKHLLVNFAPNGNTIICTVEDNGVGRGAAAGIPGRTSLGLKLTGERLGLLTERLKGEGGFVTEDLTDASGLPAGTRVRLTL